MSVASPPPHKNQDIGSKQASLQLPTGITLQKNKVLSASKLKEPMNQKKESIKRSDDVDSSFSRSDKSNIDHLDKNANKASNPFPRGEISGDSSNFDKAKSLFEQKKQ